MPAVSKNGSKKNYKRFQYTERDMEEAINAVKNGMKLTEAATHYNIPRFTLHGKSKGTLPEKRKMGPDTVLTADEEDKIEGWILGCIQKILKESGRKNTFTDDRPGRKWMELFLRRHGAISRKHTEIISKARASVDEKSLREWFAELETFLTENNTSYVLTRPGSIFNADKTGVQTGPKSGILLGPKGEKNFYEITTGTPEECISVLCTFSADARAVPSMIVYSYNRIPAVSSAGVPEDWPIGRSDSGYMIHETFYEYTVNVFYPWCQRNDVQLPVIFFLDGHKAHISAELREFCIDHEIILYCLPPNATHIMQPCDVSVFSPLKTHWKMVVREHRRDSQKVITNLNFAPLFKKAFDRLSLSPSVIQNGCRICGLYPFDPNAVDYTKCIATRRASLPGRPQETFVSMEDFITAQKVLEYLMGPETTQLFVDRRNADQTRSPPNPLFKVWEICSDHIAGKLQIDTRGLLSENSPDLQSDGVLDSEDVIQIEIENDLSFPGEEVIDPQTGHSFYYMREDCSAKQCEIPIGNWENQDLNGNNVHVDKENNSSTTNEPGLQRECFGPSNNYSGVHVQPSEHSGEQQSTQDCSAKQCQTAINNSARTENTSNRSEIHVQISQHSAESSERNYPDANLTEKATHEQNNGQEPELVPINDDLENLKVQSDGIPSSTGHSQSESQAYPSRKIPISAETFSQHCSWPKLEEKGPPKKQKEKLEFGITSVKWTEFHESKKLEQVEKQKRAAEREVMKKIKKEDLEAAKKRKAQREEAKKEKERMKEEKARLRVKVREERLKMKEEETEKPRARLQRVPKNVLSPNDVLEDVEASQHSPKAGMPISTKKTNNARKKMQEVVVAED